MKHIFIFILVLLTYSSVFCQTVVINEFMAKNESFCTDQNGEYDDWIELFNNTNDDLNLGGFFLSDDPADITRWAFPDTIITAAGFLLIWADEDESQQGLHTNFKLSAGGESIILSSPDSAIIDQIMFEAVNSDISIGRFPNGSGAFRIMNSTPGAYNSPDYPGTPADSSDLIFCDNIVYNYNLHFYYDNWQDSLIYYFENDESYIPAQVIFCDTLLLDSIGVRYKGNSSYTLSGSTPKKPFKFKFDHYKPDQSFFGLRRLNFSNCIKDPSFLREKIAYRIARHYMPAPRTAYANLYIDGQLLGFYVQIEQIDKNFLKRYFDDDSGNLFKAGNFGATLEYKGAEQVNYTLDFELKTNEALNDWSRLIEFIDKLNHTPPAEFVPVLRNYLNFDDCLRLLAFNMVLSHFDSYTGSARNYYLYDNPLTDKYEVIPWDMNESFGAYTNNWNVFTQNITTASNIAQRPLIGRIMENDSLRQVYLNYVAEMKNSPASYDSVAALADLTAPFISPYILADGNKLYSYQNFLDNIENDVTIGLGIIIPGVKSFSQIRNANISQQLQIVRVYPGDTDNNGLVDAADILPIGVYFLQSGNPRPNGSLAWIGQDVLKWSPEEASFADADGDGLIDETDVIALGVNWGNVHYYPSGAPARGYFDSQTLEPHRNDFTLIYNSLSGDSEPVRQIKSLLNSIFNFDSQLPQKFSLKQNYPNPFNASTIIKFDLPEAQIVTLTVYNLLGEEIIVPVSETYYSAGAHSINIDFSQMSSGIYFYQIQMDKWASMRKMVLLK